MSCQPHAKDAHSIPKSTKAKVEQCMTQRSHLLANGLYHTLCLWHVSFLITFCQPNIEPVGFPEHTHIAGRGRWFKNTLKSFLSLFFESQQPGLHCHLVFKGTTFLTALQLCLPPSPAPMESICLSSPLYPAQSLACPAPASC